MLACITCKGVAYNIKFNSIYNILLMFPEHNFKILRFLYETLFTASYHVLEVMDVYSHAVDNQEVK